MHDGMPYDPIQGQGQGHETFKVRNFQFSKSISSTIFNLSWQMTTDSETTEQCLVLLSRPNLSRPRPRPGLFQQS